MTALPYALGCPSCTHRIVVSPDDPDASLSEMFEHIYPAHGDYNPTRTYELLAKARELSEKEAAGR